MFQIQVKMCYVRIHVFQRVHLKDEHTGVYTYETKAKINNVRALFIIVGQQASRRGVYTSNSCMQPET